MTYKIGDEVHLNEDMRFSDDLYQWLSENDAHVEYIGTSPEQMRYIITPNDSLQFRRQKIIELKQLLADTDYKAIKFSEGELTEEEYAPIRAQRKQWREEINRLERKE